MLYVVCVVHQALQDYFDNTWILTEHLFAGLQGEEAFFVPPAHGLRHPLIFYYGHVAALYVNKLRAAGIIHVRIRVSMAMAGAFFYTRYTGWLVYSCYTCIF